MSEKGERRKWKEKIRGRERNRGEGQVPNKLTKKALWPILKEFLRMATRGQPSPT